MAYFKINRFKGIAPAVSPRLLAEGIGQTAENVDLESGRLVPINSNDTDEGRAANRRTEFEIIEN